ncbi:MAG: hypothetical protein ACRDTJ_09445, partial [Pseudonocardiaceae bacterium]
RRLEGVNAKSADQSNPSRPLRSYNDPVRMKQLDQPVLVPMLIRELAALQAGIHEPDPLAGPNLLDLLLTDWKNRSEDLYTNDPDANTLQSLIRGHSNAMAWCDNVVLARILKAGP